MNKKMWLLGGILAIPFALADVMTTLQNVLEKVLYVGGLGFLNLDSGSTASLLIRMLIFILIFTVLFAVITFFRTGGGNDGVAPFSYFNRWQAGIISAVIALMATMFLPQTVLQATGAGWATAIALVLIGGPIVGLGYLLYTIPGEGNENKWTVTIKIILCFLMLWILSAIKFHVGKLV